jgi:activator of HSP90 ATPase
VAPRNINRSSKRHETLEKGRGKTTPNVARKIIQQSVVLPARAERLFDMYLDPVAHDKIPGGPVMISAEANSEFRAFEGMVVGRTIAVVPKKKHIFQLWRGSDWKPEDGYSILVITFPPEKEGGRVELNHLKVPDCDFDDVNKGWVDYYSKPWKAYLDKEMK